MADAEFVTGPTGAPGWVLDAAFAATAALFGLGLAWIDTGGTTLLVLGLALHILVSIYHGRFSRLRKMTWVLLVGSWTLSVLLVFLAYVLPWGQTSSWLAVRLPALFRSGALTALPVVASGVALLGTVLDVTASHAPRLRTSRAARLIAVALALGVVILIIRDVSHVMARVEGAPPVRPSPPSPRILPPTAFLPFYALLRAGPTKGLGVALMFAVMIPPIAWPWRRAWRFHAAPTRRAYTLLWLAAAAGWCGLGFLGAMAPEPGVVLASQAAALYEVAFFLLVPSVLARFVPPLEDRRTEVFA